MTTDDTKVDIEAGASGVEASKKEEEAPADPPAVKAEEEQAKGSSDDQNLTDLKLGLTTAQVEAAVEKYGLNEIPVPESPLYMMFVNQFIGFLPFLIEIAALVSLAVQDYVDFGIIFAILLINGLLGFREQYHAKKSLDEISNSIESEVAVRRNGETSSVVTKDLVPGDIILLVGGTVVPADVMWRSGDKMKIDTAALTGEPIPRTYPSDEYGTVIFSGTTVVAGECYAQIMATGTSTEIGQAQADVLKDKSVRVVSVFQTKIMTVVQILVSSCLGIVFAVLLVQGFVYDGFQNDPQGTVLDALSILIASIPVALPLVLQVNLALGAAFMAKEHSAIVTSIPALQDIASMSMLCSDKTGTLTTANMSIIKERIFAAAGRTQEEILLFAYMCSNADKKDDPIDRAIVTAYRETADWEKKASGFKQTGIIGFNPTVKRVVAFVQQGDKVYTIAKGLPGKILDTSCGSIDDHELQWVTKQAEDKAFLDQIVAVDQELSVAGYKTIAVAVCEGDARELASPVWNFVGLLPMLDPPRHDTAATIASLHHANISVKMITGDHVNVGKETARLIGLGTNIYAGEELREAPPEEKKRMVWEADGFASVLPSDKREAVLLLRDEYGIVTGMTGDGVNDAPALSAAQVGIAVADATDAAQNAADLILTQPGLSPIYGAVLESRRIFSRIKSYVVYRVAASLILALTLSIIIFVSGCAVDSLLIIILALLNDISMIPVAYDAAKASTKPQLPRANKLVIQSLYYGLVHTGLALLFIFCLNNSDLSHVDSITLDVKTEGGCDGPTRGFVWFYLVLVTELMIFSVRAPSFFWTSMPSPILLLSVILTCVAGGLIAHFVNDLSGTSTGVIIAYNVGAFIFVDFLKLPLRSAIGEDPGELIENDELIEVKPMSETKKYMEKQMRYNVHRQSVFTPEELEHQLLVGRRSVLFDVGGGITDGFVTKAGRKRQLSSPSQVAFMSDARPSRIRMSSSPAVFM